MSLSQAAKHAYEAEHEAPMATMTAARHTMASRLTAPSLRAQQPRQREITRRDRRAG